MAPLSCETWSRFRNKNVLSTSCHSTILSLPCYRASLEGGNVDYCLPKTCSLVSHVLFWFLVGSPWLSMGFGAQAKRDMKPYFHPTVSLGLTLLAIPTVLCDTQAKFTFAYCAVPQGPTLSLVCNLRKSAARIKWLQPVLPALNIHLIYEKVL